MDKDTSIQKKTSEVKASLKEGRDIILDQKEIEKKQQSRTASIKQRQQQKREKSNRRSKLEKKKRFIYQLCILSYFYQQGHSKHYEIPYHNATKNNHTRNL